MKKINWLITLAIIGFGITRAERLLALGVK